MTQHNIFFSLPKNETRGPCDVGICADADVIPFSIPVHTPMAVLLTHPGYVPYLWEAIHGACQEELPFHQHYSCPPLTVKALPFKRSGSVKISSFNGRVCVI